MTWNSPHLVFNELKYETADEAMHRIAELVRQGCDDPAFRTLLADHIDPMVAKTLTGTKFKLGRSKGARPGKMPKYELRIFLERHILLLGTKQESVFSAAKEKFGFQETELDKNLRVLKAWHERNPDIFEERKAEAEMLRDQGHPDYLPPR